MFEEGTQQPESPWNHPGSLTSAFCLANYQHRILGIVVPDTKFERFRPANSRKRVDGEKNRVSFGQRLRRIGDRREEVKYLRLGEGDSGNLSKNKSKSGVSRANPEVVSKIDLRRFN